jgi:hypothetical protein
MIRWTRRAHIAPGKYQKAIQWAQETREYTKDKFEGGADVKIFTEMFGDVGVICWMVDFNNLAEVELAGQVLEQDAGYTERLQTVAELLQPGVVDKVYSSVD